MTTSRVRAARAWLVCTAAAITCLVGASGAWGAGRPAATEPAAGSLAQRSNVPGLTAARYADSFVTRRGARLYVAGRPFRMTGANSEFLGLRNYGPILSVGQHYGSERYPTLYEIDDALATLHEMGATVVRSQTIGDTVGCALCLEPSLGKFNPRAFHELDLVVARARAYGIKIIGEFAGDDNGTDPYGPPKSALLGGNSTDWYCKWNHLSAAACPTATFEDPRIIADYERHMKAVLDHVNPYTGLAYKDDPTFAGWVDGNNLWLLNKTPLAKFDSWLTKVSAYFKSVDHRQLFIDIDAAGADYLTPSETYGLGPDLGPGPDAAILKVPGVDVYAEEWYPKDFTALDPDSPAATQLHVNAAAVTKAGKAYMTVEFGWDHDNYTSDATFRAFLAGLQRDPDVSGEMFWELAAHANGHGWQPIPADERCTPSCSGLVEDGSWWAMYYTGRSTDSNTAADMAARAQILRRAAYRMDGFSHTPAHEIPPVPVITSVRGGRVLFEGSAGASDYSVQQSQDGHWITRCDRCTTDNDAGWQAPRGGTACYRVIPDNLAGVAGPASAAAGAGCGRGRARASATEAGAGRHGSSEWVGSWFSPSLDPGPLSSLIPLAGSGTGGDTVREVVHLSLGGPRLRIELTNRLGTATARFSDVRVAESDGGAQTVATSSRQVRFHGAASASVAPGASVLSDTIDLRVHAGENLSISLYAPAGTGAATVEGSLDHTTYIADGSDAAADRTGTPYTQTSTAWYWLGGVEVSSTNPRAGAIVALGDSITAGYDSTLDANRDWVDLLGGRLAADRDAPPLAMLNAGIAGNNLHQSAPCYGESATSRLSRDALDQPGVRAVIVDEGANDITQPREPATAPLSDCLATRPVSAAAMIALFKATIRRIHAAHLAAIGVTIAPFGRYAYWTPAIEAERTAINHWIRTSHAFDFVLDFDRVLADPAHPAWLDPRYDSGDGLHPNDAGHAAMAHGIDLSGLVDAVSRAGSEPARE